MRKSFTKRASAAMKFEMNSAKESYRYRLKELQDRSREKELEKVAKELLKDVPAKTKQACF